MSSKDYTAISSQELKRKTFNFKTYRFRNCEETNGLCISKITEGKGKFENKRQTTEIKKCTDGITDSYDVFLILENAVNVFKKLGYDMNDINLNQQYDVQAKIIFKYKNEKQNWPTMVAEFTLQLDDILIEAIVKKAKRELKAKEFIKEILENAHGCRFVNSKNRVIEIEENSLYIVV